jgi:hypothetical protein
VRTCRCGTILSRYNDGELCASCAALPADPEPVDLDMLVAGLLLVHAARNPGVPLNVGRELAAMGVPADSFAVQAAVRHAESRHGIVCRGVRPGRGGRPGWVVVDWEIRYRPAIGAAGVPMERRPDGTFAGVVSLPSRPMAKLVGQLSILDEC